MEQTKQHNPAKILLAAALTVVMTLALIFAILPATVLPAHAAGTTVNLSTLSAPYTAHDGETLTGGLGGDHEIFIEAGATVTLNGVVIDREVDHYNSGAAITCLGDATIILKGTNEVAGYNEGAAGITVAEGYTLTIQGDGRLEAHGASRNYGAGIGSNDKNACGNIIINSGTITATGSDYAAGIGSARDGKCGDITINGGTITATGGDSGAAIGAGEGAQCGTITINGGTIIATGGDYAAGIGSGYYKKAACTAIVINGGTITATGNGGSAAIGSSANNSTCGPITISGGAITATGSDYAAGIGSGYNNCTCGPITISGGAITATGGAWATVIGSGEYSTCGDITITNTVSALQLTKGEDAPNSIGKGDEATCGTVTVCGVAGEIAQSPYVATTITYNANGGEIQDDEIPRIYKTGAAVTLPADVAKEHFVFAGWYDNAELTGNAVTAIGADATGDKTYYAKWERVTHNITYNLNDGEWNGEYATTYVEGEGLTLPDNLTQEHFTFAGWYDNEEFTGDPVTVIDANATGDIELFAKWDHIVHNIIYHLCGGEWKDGISAPTTFSEGEMFDLYGPGCVFPVIAEKIFYAWYTTETLDENSRIEVIWEDVTSDVELWAEWGLVPAAPIIEDILPTPGETEHRGTALTVTAQADENGFVFDETHPITITLADGVYPDEGIYIEVADGYEYDEQFITTSWGDIHSGGYQMNGGDYHGGIVAGPTWPFDLKSLEGPITITISNSGGALVCKQVHMFAHYVRNITYNVNDGTMPEEYDVKYIESRGPALPVPTRNGYRFLGWYATEDFTGEPVTEITVADTGDKTFFAKWEIILYDITYNTNGGEISGEYATTYPATVGATLPTDVTKGGYDFAGWYDNAEFTGDAVTAIGTDATGDKAFFAKWEMVSTAEHVTELIDAIGTVEYTGESANKIKEAREKYNDLSDEEKQKIDAATLAKLNAAEETYKDLDDNAKAGSAADTINDLPDLDTITLGNKGAVEAARAAYNALSDDQKKKVDPATLAKLEAAEKEIDDMEKAAAATNVINGLPGSDEITTANKGAVEAARTAYNALSDDQKAKISPEALEKLEAAERALAIATANEAIDALPGSDEITLADQDAVEAARAAYEALSDEDMAAFPPEKLAKLEAAEKALAFLVANEEIDELPEENAVTLENKEAVQEAKAAYDALDEEQKAQMPAETVTKLNKAVNQVAAQEVMAVINSLNADNPDKGQVEAARAAYESLTFEQKGLVTNYNSLTRAETKLAEAIPAENKPAENKAADSGSKANRKGNGVLSTGTVVGTGAAAAMIVVVALVAAGAVVSCVIVVVTGKKANFKRKTKK